MSNWLAKRDDGKIAKGSIGDIARSQNISLAQAFLGAEVVVLIDLSGSMDAPDSRGGRSRYEVALEELERVQAQFPGKVAVVGFADAPEFFPSGSPYSMHGGTNLTAALQFVKMVDGAVEFVVISDGEPDDRASALHEADAFKSKVNVVYVGSETRPDGRDFLFRLASKTGGSTGTADRAIQLGDHLATLLLGA